MKVVDREELKKMIDNNEDISKVDTSQITNMCDLFNSSKITKLPSNFNTINVRNMGYMFYKSKITSLPANFNFINVTKIDNMFQDSNLSEEGYNKLLITLSKQRLNKGLELDISDLRLKITSKKSLLAKNRLIEKYNWEISDDGENIQKKIYKEINEKSLNKKKENNIDVETLNLF